MRPNDRSVRNSYYDRLKGFGIILVVVGHLIQYKIHPAHYDENIIFRWIYSFHMSLFMFVSGCVYTVRRPYDEICHSLVSYIVPAWVYFWGVTCGMDISKAIAKTGEYILNPQIGYWFFIVLAEIRVFNSIVRCFDGLRRAAVSVAMVILIALLSRHFSAHYVILYMPAFVAGDIFNKYVASGGCNCKMVSIYNAINRRWVAVCFAFLILQLIIVKYAYQRVFIGHQILVVVLSKFFLQIIGVTFTLMLVWFSKVRWLDQLLSVLGVSSGRIYGMHLAIMPMYSHLKVLVLIPMLILPLIVNLNVDFKKWRNRDNVAKV